MKQIIIAGIFGVAMLLAGCSSKNLNTQEATQNTIYQTLQSKQEWKIHSFKLNNTTEVLNTTLAFSECFMEVISSNEG